MKDEFDELWKRLVPESREADSVQGEITRAVGRIGHEIFGNGFANWGTYYEQLADFVVRHLADPKTFDSKTVELIRKDIKYIQLFGRGEKVVGVDLEEIFERLSSFVVIWCRKHPDPIQLSREQAPKLKEQAATVQRVCVTESIDPQPDDLEKLRDLVKIALVNFESRLVKLNPVDFLPRYNSFLIELSKQSDTPIEFIFISIHRKGSKIGEDNVCTEPLHVPELTSRRKCRYEILSFDAFNLPFIAVEVNLTTPAEYIKRKLGKNYRQRAVEQTKFVSFVGE